MYNYSVLAAAGYGCSNYGRTESYNSCVSTDGSSTDGSLADTGAEALTGILIGLLLIACAIVLAVRQRKTSKKSIQFTSKDK